MTFPQVIWTSYFFLVGATVGSFLNVCIWRLPRRCLSIFKPNRSMCPSCGKRIAWYDNIPVLSFILLGAKCRRCKAKISVRYPLVEAVTGGVFAGYFYLDVIQPPRPQWAFLGIHLGFSCAVLVASVVDWDYMIIPDRITKPGMVIAPLLGLIFPGIHRAGDILSLPAVFPAAWTDSVHVQGLYTSLFGMVMGAGIIYGMGVVGKLLFRKEAMGFGDVKFMAMLGGILGWKGVILALFIACVVGSVVGLARKALTGDSYIPFGPFLGVGSIVLMVCRDPMHQWVDSRFGELLIRVSQRLSTGVPLVLILLTGTFALIGLVRTARKP